MRARRPLPGWGLLLGAALLLGGCAIGGDTPGELPQNALDPAGPIARFQDGLWNLVFPIAVAVFVLVQGLILVAVIRFRDRGQDQPPRQVAGNTRLELIWTAIPALILAVIAVPTVGGIFALAEDPGEEALAVRVIGKQFWWEFEYLGEEGRGVVTANELHIPVDRAVRLQMEALHPGIPDTFDQADPDGSRSAQSLAGVAHSFWVPRLAGKQDVIPGYERIMRIEAEEPGQRYSGQCAEFCGLAHAEMRFQVVTHTVEDFTTWLDEQAQPADTDLQGLAAEGQELFGVHCVACHVIDGHPQNAGVRVGPDLTHFATREIFGGGIFENDDPEQVGAWIRNPPGVKPGAQMPNLGLADDQVEALVEYLQTLQ
ncbi:MAG TPA: cytochrome c oxidase subunit II [Egibacteraceae bacterium]|jgi:cytochrome c oxidase subunit II|nr:cytochrome c oxidase subunit II [Egibacteraceae bacterium]